jgi:hAT family C-terminal dimerisation region
MQEREHRYPRLFAIAMTVLAVPATSVPSERVFSSSAQTDTPRRNKLSPVTMEALQVLKFNCRNGVLDFASGIVDNPTELEMVDLDEMSDNDVEKEFRRARA